MANNRLFIVDTETGEKCFISKGYGAGWDGLGDRLIERLDNWLQGRDLAASAGDEYSRLVFRTENEMPAGWMNDAFDEKGMAK